MREVKEIANKELESRDRAVKEKNMLRKEVALKAK
jgi:hypothetical protein